MPRHQHFWILLGHSERRAYKHATLVKPFKLGTFQTLVEVCGCMRHSKNARLQGGGLRTSIVGASGKCKLFTLLSCLLYPVLRQLVRREVHGPPPSLPLGVGVFSVRIGVAFVQEAFPRWALFCSWQCVVFPAVKKTTCWNQIHRSRKETRSPCLSKAAALLPVAEVMLLSFLRPASVPQRFALLGRQTSGKSGVLDLQ